MNDTVVVFVVSDSLGETAESVVKAAGSQFGSGRCDIRCLSYVTNEEQVREAVALVAKEGNLLVYTLVLPVLRQIIQDEARRLGVIAVDIMGPMMDAFGRIVQSPPKLQAGVKHVMNEEYFRWVEAIEFAVKYDDAKDTKGLIDADVVLIGVSRTSKTPLSMYLAHKKLKVANVPLIPEVQPPQELFSVPCQRVVGLTISSNELNSIRRARLRALGLTGSAIYAAPKRIAEELAYAATIMERLGCRVIDVSGRAVEETALTVIHLLRGGRDEV